LLIGDAARDRLRIPRMKTRRLASQAATGVMAGWLLCAGSLALGAENAPPIRTLILSNGGPNSATPALKAILTDSGRFQVRVCESIDGISPAMLSRLDLVIVADRLTPGGDTEKAVAEFVASGKGLLVTRGAIPAADAGNDCPLAVGSERGEPIRFLNVKVTQPDHPIARDVQPAFRTPDSIPGGLTARTGAETVATAETKGGMVPVMAVSRSGKGRVVALALGIDLSAMHEPQYRVLLARSGEWAATGRATLPAAEAPRHPAKALRALLITGGHDHDAVFYSLFHNNLEEMDALPIDTAANAFKKDIRDKYDVIIMYDFTRELDAIGRENLRRFVESGKGIVVLHHALLNFQTWSWWSEDVVGGRYRLQGEGGRPSSSVKNGQEFFVRPVGSHPVLNGIHPFHLTDEAYKNLYISDRIKPLLTTANPASDTNLAWIGPCETSRVVAIQLGHGPSVFGHPTYRALVRNAIVWAAGRSK
jgi:type 1 glutamine amidotransferase